MQMTRFIRNSLAIKRSVVTIVEKRGRVNDADLQAVRSAGFSDEEVVEILAHVALNTFTNYFNEAFKTDIDFPVVSTESVRKAA